MKKFEIEKLDCGDMLGFTKVQQLTVLIVAQLRFAHWLKDEDRAEDDWYGGTFFDLNFFETDDGRTGACTVHSLNEDKTTNGSEWVRILQADLNPDGEST